MRSTSEIGGDLRTLEAGSLATIQGRLPRGGSLQARRLKNGAVRLFWLYTVNSVPYRETIGLYDSSAPPKKLEPTAKGFSLAAALARCDELAKVHEQNIHIGGLKAAKAEESKRQDARHTAEIEASKLTLGVLLQTYIDYLKAQSRRSHADASNIFDLHVKSPWPVAWGAPARELTPDQVMDMLRRLVEAGKGRTANKLRSYIRAAYQCAIDVRMLASIPAAFKPFNIAINPAANTRRDAKFDKPDKRPLSIEELKTYLKMINSAASPMKEALCIHLFSGSPRIEQFVKLKWADAGSIEYTIFDGKGRPGSAPRPHCLPLVKPAAKLLGALPRDGIYVFSTTKGAKPISATTLSGWAQDIVGEQISGFQLKRVRSGVETLLASKRVSREIRGHIQSHGLNGVQARHYDGHDYMEEKKEALQILWSTLSGTSRTTRRPSTSRRAKT